MRNDAAQQAGQNRARKMAICMMKAGIMSVTTNHIKNRQEE